MIAALSLDTCPVDVEWVKQKMADINAFFELPWTPVYTQSNATAAAATDPVDETDPLAYWGLAGTILFIVTMYALEGNLDARQKDAYLQTSFPKELETVVAEIDQQSQKGTAAASKENGKSNGKDEPAKGSEPLLSQLRSKFQSSQSYGLDKINFGMFSSAYDTIEGVAFLLLGFMPYIWDMAVSFGETYCGWTEQDHEARITLVYLGIVFVIGTITSLPFEIYSTFWIEKKHNFNKQTAGLFVMDKIKTLILTAVIGGPFTMLLIKIIQVMILLAPIKADYKEEWTPIVCSFLRSFAFIGSLLSLCKASDTRGSPMLVPSISTIESLWFVCFLGNSGAVITSLCTSGLSCLSSRSL